MDTDNETTEEPVAKRARVRHDLTREDILTKALEIKEEYDGEDMTLTLRQMYYQFVARGISPSGQLHYKRIGDVLTDARYAGEFPIEGLEDRGRSVAEGDFTRLDTDVDAALDTAAEHMQRMPLYTLEADRWVNQPHHVSVWVEKQALEGVFEPTCTELGVSWFACKGYPSVSALWEWIKQVQAATDGEEFQSGTENHIGGCRDCTVLYFGDHDPDGWEIPRSAERNIARLMSVKDIDVSVRFKRIGLNMDQIRRYSPPPFEAKMTSARYAGYIAEHNTDEAWELDALEPTVLRDLIRKEVNALFDQRIYDENDRAVRAARREMRVRMRKDDWLARAIEES